MEYGIFFLRNRLSGRSTRLPARARLPAWSAASASRAAPGCLGGRYSLSGVHPTGLLAWHSHWSSHSPLMVLKDNQLHSYLYTLVSRASPDYVAPPPSTTRRTTLPRTGLC